jgi:hypothetical protein
MSGVIAFIGMGFWMLMIFDCIRNEPDRGTWLWLLIFLSIPGACIYCAMQVIPRLNLPMFGVWKRLAMKSKLQSAEAAVNNLGKAHQHIVYGNLLLDMGDLSQAQTQFQQALNKEPLNMDALWGLASIAAKSKQYDRARQHLEPLLQKDPKYKYGDASLLYGKILVALADWEIAEKHLKQDIQQWSHPESVLLLAERQIALKDREAAKASLETMIFKVNASPAFHRKRHRHVLRQAKKLLNTLG